jgi:replication initiation protein RepC
MRGRGRRKEPYPPGMVLDACPDFLDYAKTGISTRRDLIATAAVIRSMLGISPSAWEEAQLVVGEAHAAIVVAVILQRGEAISSAGGYLRDITDKARAGGFSPGPMLMALIGNEKRESANRSPDGEAFRYFCRPSKNFVNSTTARRA